MIPAGLKKTNQRRGTVSERRVLKKQGKKFQLKLFTKSMEEVKREVQQ